MKYNYAVGYIDPEGSFYHTLIHDKEYSEEDLKNIVKEAAKIAYDNPNIKHKNGFLSDVAAGYFLREAVEVMIDRFGFEKLEIKSDVFFEYDEKLVDTD